MPDVRDRPAGPRAVTPLGLVAGMLSRLTDQAEELPGARTLLPDLRHARDLAAGLEPYLRRCTTPESATLARLADRTRAEDWRRHAGPAGSHLEPEMLSGHVEGQFLRMLVGLTRAVSVLEIGLFTGYSALAMAEALPPGGVLTACEIDPSAAALARQCLNRSPSGARVDIRLGPALATLRRLIAEGRRFDLVFLDADKTGYPDYLRLLLDGSLLARRGLLCVDNTLLQGEPYLPGGAKTAQGHAIAAFNAAVAADARIEQVLLPIRDGLTLIRWATP